MATGELRRNGRTVKLHPQPFKILALLLERPGELVTRDEILRQVWADGTFVDFEHSLNFAVKKVCDALSDDADRPRYVETLPRRDYRFIAPVEEVVNLATQASPAPTPETRVISISERLKASCDPRGRKAAAPGCWR